ncbi:MAG TPA: ABC transporter ATP-binding protein [candidate division Zixibacteria bacterium]|nr:ABC transporter ATP-binding protein [candidate division Zixibacteria bacterium]
MSYLKVENLSKSYGKINAVTDFSFEVNQGEIYALVGPDGAGKTTIMRTICNLIGSDSGTIQVNGFDSVKDYLKIKPLLGYMPQVFSLYPDLSVEENLTFYGGIYNITGKAYREKTEYLYRFSNLKPFAKRRAQALSGGMKQKLALSCALMHEPALLLLDEPTTGVDPLSRRQFWEILLELKKQGVTILVSTPYMDEVARADRACFIFRGRKLTEGSPADLPKLFERQVFFLETQSALESVDALNQIPGIEARRFGSGVHVYLAKNESPESYTRQFNQLGFFASDLKPIEPDLEDVFIQMMGSNNE